MSNSSPSSSSSAAAAGTSGGSSGGGPTSGSPARHCPQISKVHQQHVTVSRAHSFPKTSPLAGMDYQVRSGHHQPGTGSGTSSSGAAVRTTPQGTPTHGPLRPVTNPALMGTPTRHLPGRGGGSNASSAAGTPCGSAHTSPAHTPGCGGTGSGHHPVALANGAALGCGGGSDGGRKSSSGTSASHHHGHTSSSAAAHCRGSPRSSRKAERSKHSSCSAERGGVGAGKHTACPSSSAGATPGGPRSHSADVPPHAPARTLHSGGTTAGLHSMAANASLTPPNVVIGAVGGNPPPPAPREKDKEKKKDKDRLGLMKRLTKSKKSKSPPPDPADGATSSDGGPGHQRCRCIVPYPPQSDAELELKVGDLVFVHKKRGDGWYKGTLQRTGKMGLFPGSFVETF